MFQYLLMWFLANYSYQNLVDTYTSYHTENPISEMTDFIKTQQYREDQLREYCNLENFIMKDKPTSFDKYMDRMIDQISNPQKKVGSMLSNSYQNLILSIGYTGMTMEPNHVNNIIELYNQSYLIENINRDIIYKGIAYNLFRVGTKISEMSYANKCNYPDPIEPLWIIELNGHQHTISHIK